jgi:hypothetical protein
MRARSLAVRAVVVLCVVVGALALVSAPALAVKEYAPAGSFGEPCSGTPCGKGQFNGPTGVAVDTAASVLVQSAAGDVYVVDGGDNRVERFSSTGVYLGQFDGSGTFEVEGKVETGKPHPSLPLSSPGAVAVDDSGKTALEDPSVGDVYVADVGHNVIDKFSAEGEYLGQLKETIGGTPFGPIYGLTVDSSGELWVEQTPTGLFHSSIDEFSDVGVFLKSFETEDYGSPLGLAIDSHADVYVNGNSSQGGPVSKLDSATGQEIAEITEGVNSLALNTSTEDLLVDKGGTIVVYGPFGEPYSAPLQVFGSESLEGSFGITVNGSAPGAPAYASEPDRNDLKLFKQLIFPTVKMAGADVLSETTATLQGSLETEGAEITECQFEYGAEAGVYEHTLPCSPAAPFSGSQASVAVSANVTGLEARHTYHFRLTATNSSGTRSGQDEAFYMVTKPGIEEESSSNVDSVGASVSAQIEAGGLATSYYVEYGTTSAYGSSTPSISLGSPIAAVNVRVALTGLQQGTQYHYRFIAASKFGTSTGPDKTFTTIATVASSSQLPDNRAYELVSTSPANQNAYDPATGEDQGILNPEDSATFEPFRAAVHGDSVTYVGEPAAEGGDGAIGRGLGNQFLATREATGWTVSDITPPATNANEFYQAFSSDLSVGMFYAERPVPSATPVGPAGCEMFYAHTVGDGGDHPLFSTEQTRANCDHYPVAAGVSANGVHSLFQTPGALTAEASTGFGNAPYNLYDSVDGKLYLVNVLPDGRPEPLPSASFGSELAYPGVRSGSGEKTPDFSNVVSTDGSRIFWSSYEVTYPISAHEYPEYIRAKALYVRENDTQPQSPIGPGGECAVSGDACTIQSDAGEPKCVAEGRCGSGGGRFWTASGDGSRVFFTDCVKLTSDSTANSSTGCQSVGETFEASYGTGNDLYEYDVETGHLSDLTVDGNAGDPLGANVQGVIGASGDGSYVYFVATGVLAPGAMPRGDNLYVHHGDSIAFIATLTADSDFEALDNNQLGDWRASLMGRTAEVSSDGRAVAFTSVGSLTGYDNEGLREAFVYDALTGVVSCASCDPSGATPHHLANFLGAGYLPVSNQATFMERFISNDGDRVFFDSKEPLVAQDTNGLQDVYEWERNGAGSCATVSPGQPERGCVYLLSGGQSSDNAYLVDADESGENVFFTSRGRLSPLAHNENNAVYDARVNGGFEEVRLACTGTGCQGVPPAPPIFATPSSATFNGVGNFPATTRSLVKSKIKVKQCKRGFVKKHGKCVRKKQLKKAKRSSTRSEKGRKR